jgi:hypothetical protein
MMLRKIACLLILMLAIVTIVSLGHIVPARANPIVNSSGSSYSFRDDFNYTSIDAMVSAGWIKCSGNIPTSYYSVSPGDLTLQNDGTVGAAICWTQIPSGINNWNVTDRVSWVGGTYGTLRIIAQTASHIYAWSADGYYDSYVFARDFTNTFFSPYQPVLNSWHILGMTMEQGTMTFRVDGAVIGTYVETSGSTASLVNINIQGAYLSTDSFSYATINRVAIPTPKIELSPSQGQVGTKVTVQGSGFSTMSSSGISTPTIEMTFDDLFLGTATSSNGSFKFTLDVPIAQPGLHQIKAIDLLTGINATTQFTVAQSSVDLSISLTVGSIYFPGDTVVASVLVSVGGMSLSSSSLQVKVSLTRPDNSNVFLNTTSVGNGLFRASYTLPRTLQIGTYTLLATADAPNIGAGLSQATFEVKLPWLSSQGSNLAIVGLASLATVGVALVSWQKGFFKRTSKEPF